jgi:hypothetical protein
MRLQSLILGLNEFAVLRIAQDLNDLVEVLQIASLTPKLHFNWANASVTIIVTIKGDLKLGGADRLADVQGGASRRVGGWGEKEAGGLGSWGI